MKHLDFVSDVTRASRLLKRLFTGETTADEVAERMPHAPPVDARPDVATDGMCERDMRCMRGPAHEGECLLASGDHV